MKKYCKSIYRNGLVIKMKDIASIKLQLLKEKQEIEVLFLDEKISKNQYKKGMAHYANALKEISGYQKEHDVEFDTGVLTIEKLNKACDVINYESFGFAEKVNYDPRPWDKSFKK